MMNVVEHDCDGHLNAFGAAFEFSEFFGNDGVGANRAEIFGVVPEDLVSADLHCKWRFIVVGFNKLNVDIDVLAQVDATFPCVRIVGREFDAAVDVIGKLHREGLVAVIIFSGIAPDDLISFNVHGCFVHLDVFFLSLF